MDKSIPYGVKRENAFASFARDKGVMIPLRYHSYSGIYRHSNTQYRAYPAQPTDRDPVLGALLKGDISCDRQLPCTKRQLSAYAKTRLLVLIHAKYV